MTRSTTNSFPVPQKMRTMQPGLSRQVWRHWRCSPAFFLVVSSLSLSKARALSTTTIPSYQYNSCSSPRFDDFSEKLIGEWHWRDSESKSNVQSEHVLEIMRSCGGAVQGIREIPYVLTASTTERKSSTKEEGYYLNRSNDGFTYFDKDGSYSCGPVKINAEYGKGDAAWISSLTFGKTRLILAKNQEHCCERLKVHKSSDLGDPALNSVEEFLPAIPDSVIWDEIVRCRMPSISQPWVTQRLKWERYFNSKEAVIATEESTDSVAKIHGWMLEVAASGHPSLAAACALETSSFLWSAGGVCSDTGFVKSTIREFSSTDGSLKSVAWLRGRIAESGATQD